MARVDRPLSPSARAAIAIAVSGATLLGAACGPGSAGSTARSSPTASATAIVAPPTASPGGPGVQPRPTPPPISPPQLNGPQPATPTPTPKMRFLNWLQFQGSPRGPLLVVHCGTPGYAQCGPPLTDKGFIPAGTRCTAAVTFVPADAWHLTPADTALLVERVIQTPSVTMAWNITIPDWPPSAWPNEGASVDWVVTCVFPDGETIGYEHLVEWVPPIMITQFSPLSGSSAGGTLVTISGHGFTNASRVQFGTADGRIVTVVDDHTLTVVSPPGRAGASVDIVVTSPARTSHGSSFAFRMYDYTA